MKHFLYILYSETSDRYYVGETPDVVNRVKQHNSHYFKNGFTNTANDWIIKCAFEVNNREDALYLERFIKKMKSRKFIEKIIENQAILQDIISKK